MLGPIFAREVVTTPRRPRLFMARGIYVGVLLVLMWTAWWVLAGTQIIKSVGDMARFGQLLFAIIAPLQLSVMLFLSAMVAAGAVAGEKDKKTLILLLMTRMSSGQIVLGKLAASLLTIFSMVLTGLPVMLLITLLGGVSTAQVVRVFLVTLVTVLAAGSLGATLAFWREKTFQTLALTAVGLAMWLGIWEGLASVEWNFAGLSSQQWAVVCSPLRAVTEAGRPHFETAWLTADSVTGFLLFGLGVSVLTLGASVLLLRVWNPPRGIRPGANLIADEGPSEAQEEAQPDGQPAASGHVDSFTHSGKVKTREIWQNPILWREVCTWAYGRKVLAVKLGYLLLFGFAVFALYWTFSGEVTRSDDIGASLPLGSRTLAPFFLLSLVIINALAVTSITNERDGQSLDLLLASDLTPREIVLGKLFGVLWSTREMVIGPLLLMLYLYYTGGVTIENLIFAALGLVVMNVFVVTLGIHCGMHYAHSRSAISVSLGTVFFLFVGVVACMLLMISFSGSFQRQLTPFMTFILGGFVGLFVALGARNPSTAIGLASFTLPAATFFAITSFVIGGQELQVFLVVAGAYGFATAAMLVPAVGEFDVAIGRSGDA